MAEQAREPRSHRIPGEPAAVDAALRQLLEMLHQILDGGDLEAPRAQVAGDRLLSSLTWAMVQRLIAPSDDDASDDAGTLTALRALVELLGDPLEAPPSHGADFEELEAAMRGADAFELLVEVAHDFRSPLTSILFLAEALRDGHSGPVTDLQRSQLGLMYSAAFGLAAVASDVMDLARRRKDLTDDDAEAFALAELFATVERMVRPIVEEKGLELRVVVPDRGRARGHPHALSRVLLNLTTNALKFTDDGYVELGVRSLPHGRLEYYVKDTGRGISPQQQEAVLRPFRRRAGGSTGGYYFSGPGVGLSMARRILESMGSALRLDSSDETGTTFSFVLPASPRG